MTEHWNDIRVHHSLPLSLLLPHFSYCFFFSLLGILLGFISVGKIWGKTFRILGLDGIKCKWVVEQDLH